MADGYEPQPTVATSTDVGSGNIHIRKTNNIVSIFINGTVTIDSDGIFYSIPNDCKPLVNTYFLITPGGQFDKSYLCEVNTNGNLKLYTRGDSIGYIFGSVTYPNA